MRGPERLKGLPVVGMAAAGVVAGHWLAYAAAVPQPALRHAVLAESGHGYWLEAVKLAVVLAVCGLGAAAFRYLRDAPQDEPSLLHRFARVVLRLSLLQVAAFAAMEVTERIASNAPLGGLFQHHVLVLGLAVQVLVACLGALVLLLFGRAAARVARALRHGGGIALSPGSWRSIPFPTVCPVGLLAGAAGVRGPPPRR